MIELLDRTRLRRLNLPRAFMQDMLIPYRGLPGATYVAGWGEKDNAGKRRFEVTLRSQTRTDAPASKSLKPRKDGTARISRKTHRTLGPEHADLLVALFLIQQANLDSSDLDGVSFQLLWRAMHRFTPCGNYSGAWKRKIVQALEDLQQCTLTFIDRGPLNQRRQGENPVDLSGSLLRVFWHTKHCVVAGRSLEAQVIERILWGPAIEHMLQERLTLTFRADEYFSIRSGPSRVAYLFAPAPAAARARDTQTTSNPNAEPSAFSQSSTTLLLKLGYSPEELADRYRRHRLLLPLQAGLDRRGLANGCLSVALTRHAPPDRPRHDWHLELRVLQRRPPNASPVEDVTFVAAIEGGRSKGELYAALRHIPDLSDRENGCIEKIWPPASRNRAITWAKKAKLLLPAAERGTFTEILAEVQMLKQEGRFPFRKAPAAVAVGLVHQLLRTHEWPMQGHRRSGTSPP